MFDDVQVELIVAMQQALGRLFPKHNPMLCPKCKSAALVKEKALSHYTKVGATKFIEGAVTVEAAEVGTLVPAPKYLFYCNNPKCRAVCKLNVNTGRYRVIGHWVFGHGVVIPSPLDKLQS